MPVVYTHDGRRIWAAQKAEWSRLGGFLEKGRLFLSIVQFWKSNSLVDTMAIDLIQFAQGMSANGGCSSCCDGHD